MSNLILFFLISVAFVLAYREIFFARLKRQEAKSACLLNEFNRLNDFKKSLNLENNLLNKRFDDTLALYELTKDICKSLDEEKVFTFFNKNLKKHIGIDDC